MRHSIYLLIGLLFARYLLPRKRINLVHPVSPNLGERLRQVGFRGTALSGQIRAVRPQEDLRRNCCHGSH